ncbi:MAG TPA: di-heme oxidoredictase family protein, partial [Kofleriaceae bacterium]|nr:di-heme oxidoredictase family protein [Kofleriaceae bacterium]
ARGEAAFTALGCARCHHPRLRTGAGADLPELDEQELEPYSDLLLHDMGPQLADDRPDGDASGREWRTAPLWGLGLLHVVSGEIRLLHDGRAHNAQEAILWHGGEAQAARDAFLRASGADRAALLTFLDSL